MSRIEGVDLARSLAFFAMVIVNFKIVLNVPKDTAILYSMTSLLEGKAAAAFVVLAGMGLALSLKKFGYFQIIKRSLFLLIVGLINCMI